MFYLKFFRDEAKSNDHQLLFEVRNRRMTGSFLHLDETNVIETRPSKRHHALPGDEFFFAQFLITAQIQLSDDFFSTFLR